MKKKYKMNQSSVPILQKNNMTCHFIDRGIQCNGLKINGRNVCQTHSKKNGYDVYGFYQDYDKLIPVDRDGDIIMDEPDIRFHH